MARTSIKTNYAYQMVYEILSFILPLVTSPYVSRVLGAENLGVYSFSQSVAYYFVLFSMLGISNYGNREIARNRDNQQNLDRTFSNIFFVHMIFSLICTTLYIGYIFLTTDGRLYAIIQTAYVVSAIFDISWFYFGMEKFRLTVIRSTIVRIATVACVFLFVNSAGDLWKYCVIMAFGTLFSQLSLWIPLRRYVNFVKPAFVEMKQHIGPLFVLFIPALAVSFYRYMDKIMLGAIGNMTQLGFYENSERAVNIPLTIINSFGTVMLPRMSNLTAAGDKKQAQHYMSVSMEYVMCLAIAMAFGLGSVAMVFAPVFWGDNFTACGPLIIGLSVTVPFISFANVIRTQYLIPSKKDTEYLMSVVVGAVLNLTVNWLLIPRFGAQGAVVGTIAAETSVCLVQAFVVRKDLPIKKYILGSLPFCVFGAMMMALVIIIQNNFGIHIYTLLLQIFIGGVFYLGLSAIYFWRKKDEVFMGMVNQFMKIFPKHKEGTNNT